MSVWSDSSDGRSELDGKSEVSDYPDYGNDRRALLLNLFLVVIPAGVSGDVNKSDWGTVHVVFTISKSRRLCL